jgi:EmrB/QacA subfamily drug resistance transporter
VLHAIPQRQKIIVMLAVMSGLFLVALDQTVISTALGKIVEDFHSFTSLSWIVTAYLLTTTVTVPIAGKLSDIFGRRIVLLSGVGIFTLASLLSGSSQNIEQLIAFRALQGIGGGIITANAFTIIGDLFSPRERGKWQGIFGAVFGIASVVGPLLGGFLTDPHTIFTLVTNWRWTLWLNVPIGLVSFALIAQYCPSIRHEARPRIDFLGAGFLAVALSTLILAVDNTQMVFSGLLDKGVSLGVIKLALYGVVVVFTAGFIWIERRAEEPVIPLSFFKNRNFSTLMAVAILFGAAFLGAILYLTQFNQQVFGANATTAGLMLLPVIVGLAAASAITGQFVTKTGRYKIFMVAGVSLATVGTLALSTLGVESPYWVEAIIALFVGAGLGATMPILTLATQNEFEQRQLGVATASLQLFRGLGSTVGTAAMGAILTGGVIAQLGMVAKDPYIQTLKQSPAASNIIGKDIDANTALQLNTSDVSKQITAGFKTGIAKSGAPEAVQAKSIETFTAHQTSFQDKVKSSFADSLHKVFYVAAGLMAVASVLSLMIIERPLKGGHDDTPGVA